MQSLLILAFSALPLDVSYTYGLSEMMEIFKIWFVESITHVATYNQSIFQTLYMTDRHTLTKDRRSLMSQLTRVHGSLTFAGNFT